MPILPRPYVKRQKNDATDAEAICEAVTRANMRFVATKTLANKLARMAWAMMSRGERYKEPVALAA